MKPSYFDFTVRDLDEAKTFFEHVFNWPLEEFPGMPYDYHRIRAGSENESGISGGIGAIDSGFRTSYSYRELAAAYALAGRTEEAKTALAEALKFTPNLTIKSVERTNPIPVVLKGLRMAGLKED